MTMATIGRLMKNLDIDHWSLVCLANGFGFTCAPLAHLLNAFGNNPFPGLQAASDNPLAGYAVANRDRSNVYFVLGTSSPARSQFGAMCLHPRLNQSSVVAWPLTSTSSRR